MSTINKRPLTSKAELFSITVLAWHLAATVAFASPTGHACRKEICSFCSVGLYAIRSSAQSDCVDEGGKASLLRCLFQGLHDPEHNPGSALVLAGDGCTILAMSSIDNLPACDTEVIDVMAQIVRLVRSLQPRRFDALGLAWASRQICSNNDHGRAAQLHARQDRV